MADPRPGNDVTILGRPVELQALESFSVQIAWPQQPVEPSLAMTSMLDGIMIRGPRRGRAWHSRRLVSWESWWRARRTGRSLAWGQGLRGALRTRSWGRP